MKQFWQMMLSFAIKELLPVTILGLLQSTLYWCYSPAPGKIAFVVETGVASLHAVSYVIIRRSLRRQWTEASPYVYKSGFSLLASRSYLGIEETDHAAFSQLLEAVRRREAMMPLRPWLLINDTAWCVLLITWFVLVAPVVIIVLVMKAFSQSTGRVVRAHRAHG